MKRIGMVGVYGHGPGYAAYLKDIEGAEFVAASNPQEDMRASLKKRFKGIEVYSSALEMFEKGDLDAVIEVGIPAQRAENVCLAAEHGLDLLVDKPMAVSIEDARDICKAVKKSGVGCMMSYPLRFSTHHNKLKELLREEKVIGDVMNVQVIDRVPILWKGEMLRTWWDKTTGVWGAFLDHACHDIDAMRWLLDDDIKRVLGFSMKNYINWDISAESVDKTAKEFMDVGAKFECDTIDVEDFGAAIFEFGSGIIGQFESSWTSKILGHTRRYEIRGSEGEMQFDEVYRPHITIQSDSAAEVERNAIHLRMDQRDIWGYIRMTKYWVDTLLEGTAPIPNHIDGYKSTAPAITAYQYTHTLDVPEL